MAAFEVIALDTATPQLRAPGASDTYTFPRAVEMPLGTANGVLFLNGSKVVTSGSALTFDGTNLGLNNGASITAAGATVLYMDANQTVMRGRATNGIIFQDSTGAEGMRLTSTGLGIGTSSPAFKADVINNSTYQLRVASTTANYADGGIYLGAAGTSDPFYYGALTWNQSDITFRIGAQCGNDSGGIAFYTSGSTATQTEKARIRFNGDFLIGTSGASGNLLIVNGSTRSMLQGSRTNAAFQVDNTSGAPTWQQPNLIGHYFTGSQDAVSLRVPSSTNGSTGSYDIFADGSHIWYAAGGSNVTGSTATERARIPAAGGMVVGTAALATAATDGFLYVPTCAGTPTGTPTTQTGTAPIVVDTTNNKLYFYSGGQWRDAGP